MSLTYQTYLSSLNTEIPNEHDDWGQHYDMESQILINAIRPLKHPILNKINQIKQIKQIFPQLEQDLESGLKKYTAKQLDKTKYKCAFISSLIYVSHLVLFIILFK
jgi:hypothetical protein